MSLLHRPDCNTPEIYAALKSHGLATDRPDQLANAFRLGWLAAQPGWETNRCEDCDCEFGGMECKFIKRLSK